MKHKPEKYYRGLSKRQAARRKGEITRRAKKSWLDPSAYNPFKTDKGVKTRKSGYTKAWQGKFPKAKSLEEKAKATGVPLTYIRQCYNRGLAAWRTGHRPGATQQQWGYARTSSFLLCGKTYETTDSDLAKEAIKTSKTAKKWFKRC